MITESRKAARQALAALLTSALVGPSGLASQVYDCQPGDFGGQSPVVTVSSGGTQRVNMTFQGTKPTFWLNVHIFVLYATEDKTWTEEMAENALDDIEQTIAGVIEANRHTSSWDFAIQADRSQATSVVIGGLEYRMEVISVQLD
ncbi:MAG: hypothetical protein P4L50_03285 [Anaerolineaceae bacterium]|nr:hypothetical protein [Anaerolineaceae bacterium]